MTAPTVDRHANGSVSVSGLVRNARDTWLCTYRILPDDDGITDKEAAAVWRAHVERLGARPI